VLAGQHILTFGLRPLDGFFLPMDFKLPSTVSYNNTIQNVIQTLHHKLIITVSPSVIIKHDHHPCPNPETRKMPLTSTI
jgi:hypothetical protein